ncbi:hypothetical protein SAMN02910456_00152 [Ruminococcaceae bacterium YRB3002]|nr:hypothetical protein SAMN02910456_00152 [Ruminococcaceae bacterium YRB3002]
MENQNMDEIFKAMFGAAEAELDLDQLDDVSGGVITQKGEKMLRDGLKLAKVTGVSKKKVLELLPEYYNMLHSQFPNTTLKEVETWINKNWDKI